MTTEVIVPHVPPAAAPTAPARPDNVPEKFWDAEKGVVRTEDLLKSYTELEKGRAPAAPAEPTPTTPTPATPTPEEQAAAAGVKVSDYEKEFAETGVLSEASYAKLATAGFDKETVDDFIAYRSSKGDAVQAELVASVGGEKALDEMILWATTGYTADEAQAFNDAVNSKDKGRALLALKVLKSDFTAANPARPKLLQPSTSSAAGGAGDRFESMAELLAAQADPRYFKDAAYRESIEKKLQRSSLF